MALKEIESDFRFVQDVIHTTVYIILKYITVYKNCKCSYHGFVQAKKSKIQDVLMTFEAMHQEIQGLHSCTKSCFTILINEFETDLEVMSHRNLIFNIKKRLETKQRQLQRFSHTYL